MLIVPVLLCGCVLTDSSSAADKVGDGASTGDDAGGVKMEKIAYGGWKNAVQLENSKAKLIATLDVGPRVIFYGLKDGENVFKQYADQMGKTGEKEWQIRGGHRLWHAPEIKPRTYALDNTPVAFEKLGENGVRLTPPAETECGIQKQIDLQLSNQNNKVVVTHRLTNIGQWPIELAPWALSVMAPGGTAIIPLPAKRKHTEYLLPMQGMILWGYTDFTDERWTWGQKYILLSQRNIAAPQKIGLSGQRWAAYSYKGSLFVKTFDCIEGANYPDRGCNFETFTNEDMLELESLAPLAVLEPGKTFTHVENWFLFGGVADIKTEADAEKAVKPLVAKVLK